MVVSLDVFRRRTRKTTFLVDIPEDRSCLEWQIVSSSYSAQHDDNDISAAVLEQEDASVTSICYELIKNERQFHGLCSLARSETLHQLARLHANYMANAEMVMHSVSDVAQLRTMLQCPVVGENVQRGMSPFGMHMVAMEKLQINRDNLLNSDFHEFGVAATRGRDGKLYLCQLFR